MQKIVIRQNILRYQELLEAEREPQARARLEQLLAAAIDDLNSAAGVAPGPIQSPSASRGSGSLRGQRR